MTTQPERWAQLPPGSWWVFRAERHTAHSVVDDGDLVEATGRIAPQVEVIVRRGRNAGRVAWVFGTSLTPADEG